VISTRQNTGKRLNGSLASTENASNTGK
jgi:hypothetical protein